MTSEERKAGRQQRRYAARERKRQDKIGPLDNFDLIADPDNLYKAFKKSKKEVSWKESVQRYEMNLLTNISLTHKKLLAGESVSHGFVEFDLMERGRLRHIKSVHISERVVQKCLCDEVLVPSISRSLIHDNGASLRKKGLHFSVRRLIAHMGRYYRQQRTNGGHALMIDFTKFFDNIRHEDLFQMQDRLFMDKRIVSLVKDFVKPFGDGQSLGLGSQVSQISAIYYPNNLDHYLKDMKQLKFYGRYMDDMYIIHQDKVYLKECLQEIIEICGSLGITINARKTRIAKLSDGIKFLKGTYSLMPSGKVVRRGDPDSRKRMRRKLKKFQHLWIMDRMSVMDVYSGYQSWRNNYLKRFNAYHTVRRMDEYYNQLFIRQNKQEVLYEQSVSVEEGRQAGKTPGLERSQTA
jgi:hypothetical protein